MNNQDLQKEWMKLNKIHRELMWLSYGLTGDDLEQLKLAAVQIQQVMDRWKEEIEK
jgi:hypothetical protein